MEKFTTNINRELYKSSIGTPVYSDLNITGDSYTDEEGDHAFTDIKIPSAIFKPSRDKNVVRTSINGLNSEIVEYIGAKNWELDIDIIISSSDFSYPEEDVVNILTMLGSNQVLSVNSWFLNMLGITNIVILNESVPQIEGNLNNQRISFKALAVRPLVVQFGVGNSTGSTNTGSQNIV